MVGCVVRARKRATSSHPVNLGDGITVVNNGPYGFLRGLGEACLSPAFCQHLYS